MTAPDELLARLDLDAEEHQLSEDAAARIRELEKQLEDQSNELSDARSGERKLIVQLEAERKARERLEESFKQQHAAAVTNLERAETAEARVREECAKVARDYGDCNSACNEGIEEAIRAMK